VQDQLLYAYTQRLLLLHWYVLATIPTLIRAAIFRSNRHPSSNMLYLSDAAFEDAFSGEDLVSDLRQFHVVDARLPYSTHVLQSDDKYPARRWRPSSWLVGWLERGSESRGGSVHGRLPPDATYCLAAGLYRFPDVYSLLATGNTPRGQYSRETKLNRSSCGFLMLLKSSLLIADFLKLVS